jgi:hypothetical protein
VRDGSTIDTLTTSPSLGDLLTPRPPFAVAIDARHGLLNDPVAIDQHLCRFVHRFRGYGAPGVTRDSTRDLLAMTSFSS